MNFNKNAAIVLAFLLLTAGCAAALQTPAAALTAEQSSNDVLAGRKLFAQHCESCHGIQAHGSSRAPSLQTPAVQSMPDAALVQFLTDGDLRKGMPSWSRLPEERRWQLARYIKSLSPSTETGRQSTTGR
jgi:mono/diheme cytochrome c family protein